MKFTMYRTSPFDGRDPDAVCTGQDRAASSDIDCGKTCCLRLFLGIAVFCVDTLPSKKTCSHFLVLTTKVQ